MLRGTSVLTTCQSVFDQNADPHMSVGGQTSSWSYGSLLSVCVWEANCAALWMKALHKCIYLPNIITQYKYYHTACSSSLSNMGMYKTSDLIELKTAVLLEINEYFVACAKSDWVRYSYSLNYKLLYDWLLYLNYVLKVDLCWYLMICLQCVPCNFRQSFLSKCLNKQWKMSKCDVSVCSDW